MNPRLRIVSQILITIFLGAVGYFIPSIILDIVVNNKSDVKWESQGSPPSGADSFYYETPFVKAEDGSIYEYIAQDRNWVEISMLEAEKLADTHSSSMWIVPTKKPKGAVDYYQGYEGNGILYSVILRDGTVASYYAQLGDMVSNPHPIFMSVLIGTKLVGGIWGLGMGIMFFYFFNRKRRRKSTRNSGRVEIIET